MDSTNPRVNLGGGRSVEVTSVEDVDLDTAEFHVGGKRLTEADTREVARQIGRKHGRSGGRPSLGEGKSPQISARVPARTKKRLAKVAKAQGVREGALVRQAIEEYLSRH